MRKKVFIYPLLIIGFVLILFNGCKKDELSGSSTVKDIDGNVYNTVTIGSQVWMVENLKTTKYRNGDPIPNIAGGDEWSNVKTGAQCNYNNDATIGNKFGKLYNWYAVNDSRNLAPTGWHIPSEDDWEILDNYVAANLGTSGALIKALASKTDWSDASMLGDDLSKNNTSGFTAMPGGYRSSYHGGFSWIGDYGAWWSSKECLYPKLSAWSRSMGDNDTGWSNEMFVDPYPMNYGLSVRCVKD